MLGYEDALCGVSNGRFGAAESDIPILMDNVLCRGNEQALDHCDFNGWGNHGCTHREDAGVICDDRKQENKQKKKHTILHAWYISIVTLSVTIACSAIRIISM